MPKHQQFNPTPASDSPATPSTAEDLKTRTQEYTRQEPMRAVGTAFVIGLVLTLLPIGAVIGGVARLAFSLIRPALVVLGAMKLYEEVNRRAQ